MAKPAKQSDPAVQNSDTVEDADGNPNVPPEEQVFLLPVDWDPSSDSSGSDFDVELSSDTPVDVGQVIGWNEKLNRWIDAPPEL